MDSANYLNLCTHYIPKLNHFKENSALINRPAPNVPENLPTATESLPTHINKRYSLEKRLISMIRFMKLRYGETFSLN